MFFIRRSSSGFSATNVEYCDRTKPTRLVYTNYEPIQPSERATYFRYPQNSFHVINQTSDHLYFRIQIILSVIPMLTSPYCIRTSIVPLTCSLLSFPSSQYPTVHTHFIFYLPIGCCQIIIQGLLESFRYDPSHSLRASWIP